MIRYLQFKKKIHSSIHARSNETPFHISTPRGILLTLAEVIHAEYKILKFRTLDTDCVFIKGIRVIEILLNGCVIKFYVLVT